jgi:hypothetical protein
MIPGRRESDFENEVAIANCAFAIPSAGTLAEIGERSGAESAAPAFDRHGKRVQRAKI